MSFKSFLFPGRITGLAETYEKVVLSRGRTTKHAGDTRKRICRICETGHINSIRQLTRMNVELGLGALRPTLAEGSLWHHLRAIKSFSRWLADEQITSRDLLLRIPMPNVDSDPRHPRRALTSDEVLTLLPAAGAGPPSYGMQGVQRRMLYELLLNTGLRTGETRSLRVGSLSLAGMTPTVTVRARSAKNRKTVAQPMPHALAERLQAFIAGRALEEPLFHMPCACNVVRMLRADLRRARITYRTIDGYADAHAFRHTYITRLIECGTDLATVQRLARHSTIVLTMRYVHARPAASFAAVEKLHLCV